MESKTKKKGKKGLVIAIIIVIAIIAIVIAVFSISSSSTYKKAVSDWESGNFSIAASGFVKVKNYKDAGDYLDEYEAMLTEELTASSWSCDYQYYTDNYRHVDRKSYWTYEFNGDGTGTRKDRSYTEGDPDVPSVYDVEYVFTYDEGNAYVSIRTDVSTHDYKLNTAITEDGKMVIKSFEGIMQFYNNFYTTFAPNTSSVDSASNG